MAFPTSIELASYFGIPYNNLSTTLSQEASASDTTIYAASTTNFDAIGEATIEDEIIYHTGKTAGSFTGCTRGYGNTTAAVHTAGKQVSLTFTATMWERIVAELRAIQTALKANLTSTILTTPVIDTTISGTAIATGAEVTTGTDNTKIVTPKSVGDALVNTRLKSKIIAATRDMTAAGGDVAYTGVGFTPTSILSMASVGGSFKFSTGFADSSKTVKTLYPSAANVMYIDVSLISTSNNVDTGQSAIIKTYDADGFTLTWTKAGSPTGTLSMTFLCFR